MVRFWFCLMVAFGLNASSVCGADIEWISGLLDEESDVSGFGSTIEAAAFTGERGNNALPAAFPMSDPFDVNGITFTPVNFSFAEEPEFLTGMTYNDGEFGHTEAEEGLGALVGGLAFEGGMNPQYYELTNLTVGQGYQVEFYYYHRTVDRSVLLEDESGNSITLMDGGNSGVGGFASGYFVADQTSQEIVATANTGSQYMNGYQLRAVDEKPPIFVPPEPPPESPAALVGYWDFDNNTNDQSGNENHGTISGGVDFDSDVPAALGDGTSALFDGVEGSHVEITHNSMMPATSHTNFTISMWVKAEGTFDNVDDRVFSEGSSQSDNPLFNLGTKNDGADATFDFYYRNGSSTGHLFSNGDVFDDEWRHITWVDEDDVGTLYIDGEEDTTFDYSSVPSFEADITSIGSVLRGNSDCCNFTGNIDDVAIFSFALEDEAILALASGESPLNILIPGVMPGDFNNNGVYDASMGSPGFGKRSLQGVVGIDTFIPLQASPFQPVMKKINPIDLSTDNTEGVPKTMLSLKPILELDTELVGRMASTHELVFVEPQFGDKINQSRQRCFADSDGGHIRRFDESNLAVAVLLQVGSCHPSGGSSADNQNATNLIGVIHSRFTCRESCGLHGSLNQP